MSVIGSTMVSISMKGRIFSSGASVCGQPLKTISHIGWWSFQNHFAWVCGQPFKTISHRLKHFGLWSTFLNILQTGLWSYFTTSGLRSTFLEHFAYRFSVVPPKPIRIQVVVPLSIPFLCTSTWSLFKTFRMSIVASFFLYTQTNHTKLQSDIYTLNMPFTAGKDTGSSSSHCQWHLHFINNLQVQKKIQKKNNNR